MLGYSDTLKRELHGTTKESDPFARTGLTRLNEPLKSKGRQPIPSAVA
jgi:hypothetical protein